MRKTLLLTALIALTFSACKKSDNPKPTGSKESDKHLLAASVITNSAYGSYELDCTYDNQNLLTNILAIQTGDAGSTNVNYAFDYNSQGDLIKLTVNNGGKTSFLNYAYINKVPTTVTYSQPDDPSQNYTYDISATNSQINSITSIKQSGDGSMVSYTYSDNNKIKEVNKLFNGNSVSGYITIEDEYGTKKNPYLYSGNKWFLPYVLFANKNDLLKETIFSGDDITVVNYVNTYNNQGYPTSVKVISSYSNGTMQPPTTITYKYIDAK